MSEREPTLRDVMARLDSIDGRLDGMATKSEWLPTSWLWSSEWLPSPIS